MLRFELMNREYTTHGEERHCQEAKTTSKDGGVSLSAGEELTRYLKPGVTSDSSGDLMPQCFLCTSL